MKRLPSRGQIEPLEARIAPATIRIGAIGSFENITDTEYHEVVDPLDPGHKGPRPEPFNQLAFTDTSTSADPISAAVDSPLTNNTFFLQLQAGDEVDRLTEGGNYKPLITVKSGRVIAFFSDLNGNNDFDDGELTGLSLGANVVVEVDGSVNGDILTNLNEHGTKDLADDTLEKTGLVSPKQGIANLKVLGGSVFGSILSGGAIQSLTVAKNVNNVLAGTAANGRDVNGMPTNGFDFSFFKNRQNGTDVDVSQGKITFVEPAKQIGAGISNLVVGSVTGYVEAGAGGFGAKGGSLTNLQIIADSDGFHLFAGNGGDADATSKTSNGGAGGDVNRVFIGGTTDNTPNSGDGMVVKAGTGGNGLTTGKGGVGGKLSVVQVGYELSGSTPVKSGILSSDSVSLSSGGGGAGKIGGAGGLVSAVAVRVLTPDANGNEIEVLGGGGGISTSPGGKAGVGGSIVNVELLNQISTPNGDILVQAGGGGTSRGANGSAANPDPASAGAAGGSVQKIQLLGFDAQVIAGDGSDGSIGGLGGTVSDVTVRRDDFVIPRNVLVDAGHGGVGFANKGGGGGTVHDILVGNGDFESFIVNAGIAGDGGEGFKGVGGSGGGVTKVSVSDFSNPALVPPLEGSVNVRAGRGADGTKAGGVGGSLNDVVLIGTNLNLTAAAGDGGNATLKGKGGAGGVMNLVQLGSEGSVLGVNGFGKLQSGAGGAGKGANGTGGVGGDIRVTSISVDGDGTIIAGKGGSGQVTTAATKGGAAGRGGSIVATGLVAQFGSGFMQAGDAGVDGAKPAAGGSILSSGGVSGDASALDGLRASAFVTVLAGSGSHGGQGGDIIGLTYGSTAEILTPTPFGSILIQAGAGSSEGKLAGRGGNIDNVNGAVSSGIGQTTQLLAGDGGGGAAVLKPGAGGSISNITIARGGAVGGVLRFEAGDAGNAPAAKTGAKGGNVSSVGVDDIDPGTILRSVAAGNGGNAIKVGGLGGSIARFDVVNHDIGLRTGAAFGYDLMGGLFAGVGGTGTKAGLNGNVIGVTADAISSIVAGRVGAPHLAERVGDILVAGDSTSLLLVSNLSLVPNGDFKLRFGTQETALLKSGATDAEVAAALNLLPGIIAAGGVTVASTENFGYAVHFKNTGNQAVLSGLEIVKGEISELIKGAIKTVTVTPTLEGAKALTVTEVRSGDAILGVIETVPGTSTFTTSEEQAGSDTQIEIQVLDLRGLIPFPTGEFTLSFEGASTFNLPSNATAQQIENALNALPTITIAGGVTVTLAPNETARFVITFNNIGAESTIIGTKLVPEVQRVTLGAIPTFANAEFVLTFGGETTAPIPSKPGPGPDGIFGTPDDRTTTQDIADALNALQSVQNVGGVTVAAAGVGQFDVKFGINGTEPLLSGKGSVPELQRVAVGALPAGATFTINVENESTVQLPANATAAQVETALNNLVSIQGAGGVTVSLSASNTFDITYKLIGDQTNVTAAALQHEQQTIDLTGATGPTSEFTLAIQHVLPTFETVKGTIVMNLPDHTGDVDVTDVNPNADPGVDLNAVVGTTVTDGVAPQGNNQGTREVQLIDVNNAVASGERFVLEFGGQTTDVIPTPGGALPLVFDIQTALNSLGTIATAGFVTVVETAPGSNIFRVTFDPAPQVVPRGDQPQITGFGRVVVPQTGEFTFQTDTVANGTPTVREVQVLNLQELLAQGGLFTLNFAGQSTGVLPIAGSANTLETDLLNSINNIVAVGELGGVIVTERIDPNGLPTNIFDISFQAFGDVPSIFGKARVRESQLVDVSSLANDPTGEFTLTFKGQPTIPLSAQASTAQDVEDALNALGSIIGQGRVTVSGGAGVFQVDFNQIGFPPQQPELVAIGGGQANFEHQEFDLGPLAAYSSGFFQLTFGGQTTKALPVTAAASDIADELNLLPAVKETRTDNTGNVVVTETSPGHFDIAFQVFGDQTAVSAQGAIAVDRYPVLVTQTHDGSQLPVIVSETRSGGFFGAEVQELVRGDVATNHEVQRIDLSGLANSPTGEFVIGFGALSTVKLSAQSTVAEIQAAINTLPTVQNAGGVTVAAAPNGAVDLTFTTFGDKASFAARLSLPEVQTVDLAGLTGQAGGEFTLTFKGYASNPLPVTATAAQLQAALNLVPSITEAGGVAVSSAAAGKFDLTFGKTGDVELLAGSGGGTAGHEEQQIKLGGLQAVPNAEFKLTFDGQTTSPLLATATAADIQAALNALNSVKDVRSDRTGMVTVTDGGTPGVFKVAFNVFGDQPILTGKSLVTADRVVPVTETIAGSAALVVPVTETTPGTNATQETQTLDLTNVVSGNGEFQLRFDDDATDGFPANTTVILPKSATAAQIETALNDLDSINAVGGVTVTPDAAANKFKVTFNAPGNEPAISGFGGQHEQQNIVLGELASFANGVVRLSFNGEFSDPVKVTATPAEVKTALDALPSIKALRPDNTGSVTVSQSQAGEFRIDFNDLGIQPKLAATGVVAVEPALDLNELTGGADFAIPVVEATHGQAVSVPTSEKTPGTLGSKEVQHVDLSNVINLPGSVFQLNNGAEKTAVLPRFAKAADIQAALNALPSIGAAGNVTVTSTGSGGFDVTFNSNGDQPVTIGGTGGVQEVQHIDAGQFVRPGDSSFVLKFGNDTTPPLPDGATSADVEAALNNLPSIQTAGNVTVSPSSSGFEVHFNSFGDQNAIAGTVSLFEQQVLDLHHFPTTENGKIRLTFGADTTAPLDADSVSIEIENALNGLPSIQALNGGTGSVSVVNTAPGIFRIDFNVAGNQTPISGSANPFGTTERLNGNSTTAQIDAALDSVSFVDISVIPGSAPGKVIATFLENLDQPLIAGKSYIHEQQRSDIYAVGDFSLTFNGNTTSLLHVNATAAEIRAALNVLPSVIAAGGVRDVTIGENSSFSVVFEGDGDEARLDATQVLTPLPVTSLTDLTGHQLEVVNFIPKLAFVTDKFRNGHLVGAIVDFNEIDSNVFHFLHNGVATSATAGAFVEGDVPIDGIVMAKFFDQSTVNFIPEAKLTATGFFDSNNRISL